MTNDARDYGGPRDDAGRPLGANQRWSYTPPGSQVNLNEPIWQSEDYTRGAFLGRPSGRYRTPVSDVWQVRGPHVGKGPKAERQDAFIQEEVSENLSQHPQLDASDLSVYVEHGVVTLDGTVSSRWEKREAERAADEVPGVKDVRNQLEIRQDGRRGS